VIAGRFPSLSQRVRGCRFADRCEFTFARCREEVPRLMTCPRWTACALPSAEQGAEAPRDGGSPRYRRRAGV